MVAQHQATDGGNEQKPTDSDGQTCPGCGVELMPANRWHWECPTCGLFVERTGTADDGSVKDRLIGAFDVAGRGFDPVDDLDVTTGTQAQVGIVRIQHKNASVVINCPNSTGIDEALGLHGWEVGTIRYTPEEMVVSVYERGRADE